METFTMRLTPLSPLPIHPGWDSGFCSNTHLQLGFKILNSRI
jgi:hypothetical protein